MRSDLDIVVIGGGHAGLEAAWAAGRLGARTALVSLSLDRLGLMSCNPAIGGLGKSQIVREVDAMGGLIGLAADATGIQFRLLNRSKGPAVRAPRAQTERRAYPRVVREMIEQVPEVTLIEGCVDDILADGGPRAAVRGVRLADGRELAARCVVLAAGTFLRGLMHCGPDQTPGGRRGEPPAERLSASLQALGLTLGRLKTGTPPRIARASLDLDKLQTQPGDKDPVPFSFMTDRIDRPQIHCWITHTNARSHELIRANLHRAPMYSGQITSTGPRYCPSIEDKVVRFPDKWQHQLFLEPEGVDDRRVYCNGIPTSLPVDVQEPLVHSIWGLEHAEILQVGYAIEYDFVPPDQIDATLAARGVPGLFLAGQTNGTSGYEEAAGQGLVAGVNAVRRLQGKPPVTLGRDEAYIGVMIDDLVTRPPVEPYRMFTSRAEYRLVLRCDNADRRLTPRGREIGLVDDARWVRFNRKQRMIERIETILSVRRDSVVMLDLLRRPSVTIDSLLADREDRLRQAGFDPADPVFRQAAEQVEIAAKYAGYVARQQRQIDRHRQLESRRIPDGFDFAAVPQLRFEAREKLARFQPRSLGAASRISGISPADVAVLLVALERRRSE